MNNQDDPKIAPGSFRLTDDQIRNAIPRENHNQVEQELPPASYPPQEEFVPPPQYANPLLQRLKLPPEIHKLPSNTTMYGPDVTRNTTGEYHIYPMTALDELEIKSPDLLFSGEAVANVIRRCVPDIINPMELFVRDVDYIMLVIRKATFGTEYEIEYTHDCDGAKEHQYIIDLNNIIQSAKTINPIEYKTKSRLTIGTDDQLYNVTLAPMRLKHLVKLMQSVDLANDENERKEKLFSALVMLINDIDGIVDESLLVEFLSTIPTTWTEKIANQAEDLGEWGPVFNVDTHCKDCGKEVELHVNTNPLSFFTSS